jgi:hypothetical protein
VAARVQRHLSRLPPAPLELHEQCALFGAGLQGIVSQIGADHALGHSTFNISQTSAVILRGKRLLKGCRMHDWTTFRGVILACALMVVPAMAIWDGRIYSQLASDGVEAAAIVTDKSTRSGRSSKSYHVAYRFQDNAGRRWWGSQSIPHERYAQLRVGQRIEVVYSRSNPDVSAAYLDVLRERIAIMSLMSATIGLIALMAVGCWRYARRKTLEHDDAMGGMPA